MELCGYLAVLKKPHPKDVFLFCETAEAMSELWSINSIFRRYIDGLFVSVGSTERKYTRKNNAIAPVYVSFGIADIFIFCYNTKSFLTCNAWHLFFVYIGERPLSNGERRTQ